jgi:hypothetical protein
MKKTFAIASLLAITIYSVFAQDNFKHISFVTFNSKLSYTIGEDSQSFTAQRTLSPFSINKYETTYGLWYQTRILAQEKGYYFQNPGQPGSDGKYGAKADETNVKLGTITSSSCCMLQSIAAISSASVQEVVSRHFLNP